jgi:DeoR/GlpR family transcriptional regulator of sugar metabolism
MSDSIPATRDFRHQAILEALRANESVDVGNLARRFSVTEMTVRRDLRALDRAGKLSRVHGGARRPRAPEYETRAHDLSVEKRRIAAATSRLIPDGSVVGIDMGSTCYAVAEQLADRNDLIIVTYSLRIALAFQDSACQVIMLGGTLTDELTLVDGPDTHGVSSVNLDTLVLGCAGVTAQSVSCYNMAEANVRRSLISASSTVLLAADNTKFDRHGPFTYMATERADLIVTDEPNTRTRYADFPAQTRIVVADRL